MVPVETKVKASTTAAAISGLALWAMGRYLFKHGVPDVVASWVYVVVPGVLALAAGYLAPHTSRTVAGVAARSDIPSSDPPMDPLPPAVPPANPVPGLPEAKM